MPKMENLKGGKRPFEIETRVFYLGRWSDEWLRCKTNSLSPVLRCWKTAVDLYCSFLFLRSSPTFTRQMETIWETNTRNLPDKWSQFASSLPISIDIYMVTICVVTICMPNGNNLWDKWLQFASSLPSSEDSDYSMHTLWMKLSHNRIWMAHVTSGLRVEYPV